MNTILQDYKEGQIAKTRTGKYLYITKNKTSKPFDTIADLVKSQTIEVEKPEDKKTPTKK